MPTSDVLQAGPAAVVGEMPPTLAHLVARARPLRECLSDGVAPGGNVTAAERLLRTWQAVVAGDDAASFDRRLAWDGLDRTSLAARLADVHPTVDDGAPMPRWASIFWQAYGVPAEQQNERGAYQPDRARRLDEPLPYEALHLPLLEVARRRLRGTVHCGTQRFDDAAMATLEHTLLDRLSRMAVQALNADFTVRRDLSVASNLREGMPPPTAAEQYAAFVHEMQRGGMLRFYSEYPVLARLTSTVTALWVDATAELVERTTADANALAQVFGAERSLGVVTSVQGGLSDPHNGGRSVAILQWSSGVRVVYKPRSLGIDAAFAGLVDWLNVRGDSPTLRALVVLDRGEYGWIEHAQRTGCEFNEVPRYFERCGALLAVAYALNGTDFHYDNLLAAGDQAILLDLETLLEHRFDLSNELPVVDMTAVPARRALRESVVNVMMLPAIKVCAGGTAVESGALGGPLTEAPRQYGKHNLPLVGGAPVEAFGYVREIESGFRSTYRVIMSGAKELATGSGPLAAMRHHPVRFILRNTSLYGALLDQCLQPAHLRCGMHRGAQLDILAKTFLRLDERPAIWPLVAEEARALERMDIPFFVARVDDRSITLADGGTVSGCFQRTAYEEMRRRMARLSPDDLERQVGIITAAYRAADGRGLRAGVTRRAATAPAPVAGALAPADARAEAERIAERLLRNRVGGCAGVPAWVGPRYLPAVQRFAVSALPHTLIDGYGGLALFLAALARVSGNDDIRREAVAALAPVCAHMDDLPRMLRLRRTIEPGIGCGVGSVAYVLAASGRCMEDDGMLAHARVVSALMAELSDRVRTNDLVSGAAGALLAILAVHRAVGGDEHLAGAMRYGHQLLARRSSAGRTGLRGWPAEGGGPESGVARGQAGIAQAMRLLGTLTGTRTFVHAADEAIALEVQLLAVGGDELRRDDERRGAWSHGATGIALARLAGCPGVIAPTHPARGEIEGLLAVSRAAMHEGSDTLCCGTAARIELLASAAVRLDRPALRHEALVQAAVLVARGRSSTGYETGWGHQSGWEPGLFLGESGIGMTLLRLTHPDVLPAPLTAG